MLVTSRSWSAALAVAAIKNKGKKRAITLTFRLFASQKLQDRGLGLPHMFFPRMRLARPEEAAQAVLFAARHNVHMQMRNALADAIVDGDERSLGLHRLLDGAREQLHVGEERPHQLRRQIGQRFIVRLGNEQRVPDE